MSECAKVTKHKVLGTNGVGSPYISVRDVEPGTIVRFGVDDDMTALVIGNYITHDNYFGDGKGGTVKKDRRALLLYGCFCDEPGPFDANRDQRSWEEGRLFEARFEDKDVITIVLEPGMY